MSFLPFVVFFGSFCGSFVWGILADMKGRKPVIQLITVLAFLLGLLSAFSPSYTFFAFCRSGVGFLTGGTNVVVSYCMEMLPTESRGTYGILIEDFWTLGRLLQVVLASIIFANATRGSWRTLVGWSSLPVLICFKRSLTLLESPRYLVSIDQGERAYEVLYRVSAENSNPLPLTGTLAGTDRLAVAPSYSHGCYHGLRRMRFMFSQKFRRTSLLLLVIWFANAFTYYGVVLLGAALVQEQDAEEFGSTCSNTTLVPFQRKEDYVDLFIDTIVVKLLMDFGCFRELYWFGNKVYERRYLE